MPDQNGIMTPDEIGHLGTNALLKVFELKMRDEQLKQQAALFKQQLESGQVDLKMKHVDLEMKEWLKRLKDAHTPGPDGKPSGQLFPGDFDVAAAFGLIPKRTPFDVLPESDKVSAGQVAGGIRSSADAALQAKTTERGQDLTATAESARTGVMQGQLDLEREKTDSATFQALTEMGANAYQLAQAPLTDLKNVAKALEGVTPTQRINAWANLIGAQAQQLQAQTVNASQAAEAARITQEGRNKFRPLELLIRGSNSALANLTAAQATGDENAIKQAIIGVTRASAALEQEYLALGYKLPAAAPDKGGFWSGVGDFIKRMYIGGGASSGGGIDDSKLQKAFSEGDLTAEIGSSQGPGAATPSSAAPPNPTLPPAATAPTSSSLPLTSSTGAPVPYISSPEVMAQLQAAYDRRLANGGDMQGVTRPGGPTLPLSTPSSEAVNLDSSASLRVGKEARRDALLRSIKLYIPIEAIYSKFASELLKFPIDEQIQRLESGLKAARNSGRETGIFRPAR